ncbi:MAG: rhomboid family intramembrane serine protease [Acidobacteriota bacterium]
MIPIRDNIPSRTYPIVNLTLIGLNVLAFFYELALGPGFSRLVQELGVVPAYYFHSGYQDALGHVTLFTWGDRFIPLFTSMFLHGGWFHILGNMLYLYIFGDNVEDRVGHLRYLVFYLLCGLLASFAHIVTNASSTMPSIGASGAVAGVLGAYLMLYPGARVVVLVPIFFLLHFMEVPAVLFLGLWFLYQFLSGGLSLGMETAQTGGIAWWAHIGGFIAGAVLIWLFRKPGYRRPVRDTRWASRYPRHRF